jgi:hypothetical protein
MCVSVCRDPFSCAPKSSFSSACRQMTWRLLGRAAVAKSKYRARVGQPAFFRFWGTYVASWSNTAIFPVFVLSCWLNHCPGYNRLKIDESLLAKLLGRRPANNPGLSYWLLPHGLAHENLLSTVHELYVNASVGPRYPALASLNRLAAVVSYGLESDKLELSINGGVASRHRRGRVIPAPGYAILENGLRPYSTRHGNR